MKPVLYHPEATAELGAAAGRYEALHEGLGLALIDEVERATSLLAEHPLAGAEHHVTPFRRFVLRRFPFSLFYLDRDDAIWVVAVAHAKRRPGYWRQRAR